MKTVAGWRCPDLLGGPGNYLRRTEDLAFLLEHTPGRGLCIQAGGHIGTWPITLAETFETVMTFEPGEENFLALKENIATRGLEARVLAARAILGKSVGRGDMRWSDKSTGQHRVKAVRASGALPIVSLNSLNLPRVDAIVLDVEGFEIPALKGASEILARDRPIIQCEENKRCRDHGFEIGDLERFLAAHGYRVAHRVNDDIVFRSIQV